MVPEPGDGANQRGLVVPSPRRLPARTEPRRPRVRRYPAASRVCGGDMVAVPSVLPWSGALHLFGVPGQGLLRTHRTPRGSRRAPSRLRDQKPCPLRGAAYLVVHFGLDQFDGVFAVVSACKHRAWRSAALACSTIRVAARASSTHTRMARAWCAPAACNTSTRVPSP